MKYQIRPASHQDVAEIETVMRLSLEVLGRGAYDEAQVASAQRHTAFLDVQMIEDGTYYVVVAGDRIAACGGWSRRAKLFPGGTAQERELHKRLVDKATEPARIRAMFVDPNHARRGLGRRLLEASENAARAEGFSSTILLAMHSGIELYRACGYVEAEPYTFETPDGIELPCTVMTRRL
jgi:GNAT superfamily N-acetyltransferase